MASLTAKTLLIKNSHLLDRISGALAEAAEDIRNEGAAVENHVARFAWATDILLVTSGPRNEAKRAIWLVVQNATVADGYTSDRSGASVTDNDVQFVVNGLVNILAGVES